MSEGSLNRDAGRLSLLAEELEMTLGIARIFFCASPGRNDKGQLGHGDTKRVDAPKPIELLSSESAILAACGRNHTLVLTGIVGLLVYGPFSSPLHSSLAQSIHIRTGQYWLWGQFSEKKQRLVWQETKYSART